MILQKLRLFAVTAVASALLFACSKEQNEHPTTQEEMVAPASSEVVQGQYIVVFNTAVTGDDNSKYPENYIKAQQSVKAKAAKLLEENAIRDAEIVSVYSKTINGATLKLSADQADLLRGKKEVDFIEEDQVVSFAPPGKDDGVSGSAAQEIPYGILRVNGVTDYSGSGVAWVIDTGIDLDHEDLNVDASRGFNAFKVGRDAKSLDDGNGHGSHVAGTIAALNNNIGVVGVAPGATVIPVKVLDARGSGSYSGVIAGVDHVAAYGNSGDVANMSLGGSPSDALDQAVLSASENGIKFALAAGNDGADANNSSPARVNGNNIVTISAMDSNDDWAYFSNYGNPPVDYAAPGVAVKSTWKNGEYNTISGTSMAAPHAAGVLLLGNASTDGTVNGDPDGTPDPVIVH